MTSLRLAAALLIVGAASAPARLAAQSDPRLVAAVRLSQDGLSDSARAVAGRILAATRPSDSLYPEVLYTMGLLAATEQDRRLYLRRVVVDYAQSVWADDALLHLGQLDYTAGERRSRGPAARPAASRLSRQPAHRAGGVLGRPRRRRPPRRRPSPAAWPMPGWRPLETTSSSGTSSNSRSSAARDSGRWLADSARAAMATRSSGLRPIPSRGPVRRPARLPNRPPRRGLLRPGLRRQDPSAANAEAARIKRAGQTPVIMLARPATSRSGPAPFAPGQTPPPPPRIFA